MIEDLKKVQALVVRVEAREGGRTTTCSDSLTKRRGAGMIEKFPTLAEVEKASLEQLGHWHRFLLADDADQQKILEVISAKIKKAGGISPALSRKIGYGGV